MSQIIAPPPVQGHHLIAGSKHEGAGFFNSTSPADSRIIVGMFPKATATEANAAVAAARAAYPAWRRQSRVYRADLFDNRAQITILHT
jgi:acyl-CoA reductase-like NAD-dependent aldehyde dehydrogenase